MNADSCNIEPSQQVIGDDNLMTSQPVKWAIILLLVAEFFREFGLWGAYSSTNELYIIPAQLGLHAKLFFTILGAILLALLVMAFTLAMLVQMSDWAETAAKWMATSLVLLFGNIVISIVGMVAGNLIYGGPGDIIAEHSKPIVEAIEQYQSKHNGVPPAELETLLPDYLDMMPELPAALPDQYSYIVYSDGKSWGMTTSSSLDFGFGGWHYLHDGTWARFD